MSAETNPSSNRAGGLFATGSVLAAVLASTCCIVPLVLVTLGVSGAWIGSLTALEPFKPYFLAGAAVLLAAGFWQAYSPPKTPCEGGDACAKPESRRITKIVLWIAAALAALAATIEFWAPLFY